MANILVKIVDVQYPDDSSSEEKTAVSVAKAQVSVIDISNSGFSFGEQWIPIHIYIDELLFKYGNTLKGRKAIVHLPKFPNTKDARVINILPFLAKKREDKEEAKDSRSYLKKQRLNDMSFDN